jgi:hypothetical protein
VRTLLLVPATLILAVQTVATTQAAVRTCLPPVVSDVIQADTDLAGKRQALESWTTKVARIGPQFGRWQLATKRVLACRPMPTATPGSNRLACVASAQPCTIQQNPGQQGPGVAPSPNTPKRRLIPRPGKNVPFEV